MYHLPRLGKVLLLQLMLLLIIVHLMAFTSPHSMSGLRLFGLLNFTHVLTAIVYIVGLKQYGACGTLFRARFLVIRTALRVGTFFLLLNDELLAGICIDLLHHYLLGLWLTLTVISLLLLVLFKTLFRLVACEF